MTADERPRPPHRSYSQFSTYVKCGEQYRLQRRTDAPERPAAWFIQGSAFHAAVEEYELSGRTLAPGAVLDIAEYAYDERVASERKRQPDLTEWMTGSPTKSAEADIAERRDRAIRGVQEYLEYAQRAPEGPWEYLPGQYAVELEVRLDLGDGLEVLMYVDQVVEWPDGQLTIRDFKTGARKESSGFPLQLAVAALGVEQQYGVPVRFGDYWYTSHRQRPYGPVDGFVDLERFTLDRVRAWFATMDRAEKAEIYLPNPGDNCRTCSVSQFCSAVGGARAGEF